MSGRRGTGLQASTGARTASTPVPVLSVFGACNPRPEPPPPPDPGPSWAYCSYEVVSLERFVVGHEESREVGGLRQRLLRGDDGSVEPHALLHPDFDTPLMRDTWTGDGLVPQATQWGGLPEAYADAECSMPALCFPDARPASPLDPVVTAPADCQQTVLVSIDECSGTSLELGDRLDGVQWCGGAAPQGQPLACYAQQRVVAPIAYTEAALGTGRLRPVWITQGGEPVLPTGYFEDAALDTLCAPNVFDGRLRCEPTDPVRSLLQAHSGSPSGFTEHFADAECANSLGFSYVPRCGETPPTFARLLDQGLVRMRPRGTPTVTQTYTGFSPSPGIVLDCMPAAGLPSELYTPERVDVAEFAAIDEVVR